MPPLSEPRSVFHIGSEENLSQNMQDCCQGLEEFRSAMKNLDGAGTHLTESLTHVLRGTSYQRVGEQLAGGFREVYGSQQLVQCLEQLKDIESMLLALEMRNGAGQEELRTLCAQTVCHILLLFAKLQKQYFQVCHQKMADLLHHFLSGKDLDRPSEITKFILKLGLAEELSPEKTIASLPSSPWSSPKLRKTSHGSPKSPGRSSGFKLFSLFERKPSPEEGKSAFYVSVPDGLGGTDLLGGGEVREDMVREPPSSTAGGLEGMLLGSVPLVTMTDEMNNVSTPDIAQETSLGARLASEEDLDSVINLLSGVSCTSPLPSPTAPPTPNSMHSIPEDPLRGLSPSTSSSMQSTCEVHPSRSPMQLMVPNVYRMRSPASDTQLEELQIPKLQTQVHRRSEGCLDLSGMGRSTWPHHQQHHRASLPAVQPHTHFRQSFDPAHDPLLPSSQYVSQDFGTPGRMPPVYLGSSSNAGGSGSGTGSAAGSGQLLSGPQWSFGGVGSGGGVMDLRGSGTWPIYQPMGMPFRDTMGSSWSGAPDISDGSDDSSNGDHFFAVGKDLVSALDSRNDSSDDEAEGSVRMRNHKEFFDRDRQIGNTHTWPLMQQLGGPHPGMHFPPASEFPDILEPPPPQPHRPLQMQWSDPLSTHSMWSTGNTGLPHQKTSQSMHGFGRLN